MAKRSTKTKPAKEAKFYDEGGQGRKQCPHCNKFVGAKSKICPNPSCGKEIPQKSEKKSGKRAKGKASSNGKAPYSFDTLVAVQTLLKEHSAKELATLFEKLS